MTFLPDAAIVLVAERFDGDELIDMWGAAVDSRNLSLADAYAAAITEKTVREAYPQGGTLS